MNNPELISAGLAQFEECKLSFEEASFHARQIVRCTTDALGKLEESQAIMARVDYSTLSASQIFTLNILSANLNELKATMNRLLPPQA